MNTNCANCRFFHCDNHSIVCRRHAPELPIEGYGRWPKVGPEEWCGEFESKPLPTQFEIQRVFYTGQKCCICERKFDPNKDNPLHWWVEAPPGGKGGPALHYCPDHKAQL